METNTIYCGDNLKILRDLPENSVDLIYADPPFFSEETYEVIWNDGAERAMFEDRFQGNINHYVGWMRERLELCHTILKDTGSMYLHCDWHANSYLRVAMDKIFGYNNLQNEIIWCYKGGGIATHQFKRKHDTILLYTKSNKYTFNAPSIKRGHDKFYKNGVKVKSDGRALEDWWADIPSRGTATNSKEWLGYPTQKPEGLLKRIIETSSNKDDIVLDPFCGCGTSISVAQQFNRRYIGIDVSPTACRKMATRLNKLGVVVSLKNMPETVEHLKTIDPYEFQNWVVTQITGKHSNKKSGDMGIDGYHFDHKPIQVKQSDNIGRNVVDNFETAIRRAGYGKGYIYAFSFGKGAYEEVARALNEDNLDIALITVDELVKGKVIQPIEKQEGLL
jgi:DNA modification methylase